MLKYDAKSYDATVMTVITADRYGVERVNVVGTMFWCARFFRPWEVQVDFYGGFS